LMIEITYTNFISESKILLEKSKSTLDKLPENDLMSTLEIGSILRFVLHAERQIEQLYRRIILKESIPHNEKVFSVFEEYTEWLCKGKAGVPVELGLKVCISSDQHGFILTHQVMQKQQDVDVAVPMINKVQQDFPQIYSASFDRGFYSKTNQEVLKDKVVKLIMPKKGKLSSKDKEAIKSDLEYQKLRRKHSAVESDINAIEVHALDRCPDRGIKNFRRYVSLAIAAHNIHKIGALVQKKKCSKIKRQSLNIRIAA
jgi:transposase, IS5 family